MAAGSRSWTPHTGREEGRAVDSWAGGWRSGEWRLRASGREGFTYPGLRLDLMVRPGEKRVSGGFCHYVALLHIAVHLNHWHGAWTSFLSLIIPAWDQIPFCLCVSGWTSMLVSWHYWICGTRYCQRGDWGHDRVCSVSDTSLYTSLKCVIT